MTRAYKITHLPEGYSKLAIAAWQVLSDLELFEIEGKLVFTDGLEEYLLGEGAPSFCVYEFDSHSEFERWLLNGVADWIKNDSNMIETLDQQLKLA